MSSVSVAVRAGVLVVGTVALVAGPVAPAAYGAAVGGGARSLAPAARPADPAAGAAAPGSAPAPASPVAPVPAGGGYAAHVADSRSAPRTGETGPTGRQLLAGLLLAGVALVSAVLAARVRRPGRD
ncbi:hypothetical protein [Streptomyces griseoaurantiacus]|uniref:Uncharacterized protein n=1 Tax=Streptomyces griseoaurantiacus TaxID=68213 RepID=A0A1G7BBP0_9ACTN|nr:hypothetical protein [Streptomyces jietaisiensis]SDE23746.1 hypothetical protein SAMN05216260_10112 [Streptomyces jietaisiensis]